MKTVRLRAWNTKKKEWFFYDEEIWSLVPELTEVRKSKTLKNDLVVTQFTGLSDVVGKPIFEGDILRQRYKVNGEIHDFIGIMFWNPSRAQFGLEADAPKGFEGKNIEITESVDGRPEIIGNVFENPDLLKKDE